MKSVLVEEFNIKKYSVERKWWVSLSIVIFILAIAAFISTSWFSIDRAVSDSFGKLMMNTKGSLNKFIRGWATYFDLEPYKYPFVFVCILFFVLVETIFISLQKRFPNIWLSKRKHFVSSLEVIISVIVLAVVWYLQYESYMDGGEFGYGFYAWTMAGKDIVWPSYILSSLVMTATQVVLTLYVHKVLAKRDDFISSRYWELAVISISFFLLVNYIYVNGLKGIFNRPYEVNLRWGDWKNKIIDIYGENSSYIENYNKSTVYWGWVESGKVDHKSERNYDGALSFPWWKINKQISIDGIRTIRKDAFPSGHMNCALFLCARLLVLFRNPRNNKERIYSRILIPVGILYVLNMVFILEYSWSHWLSDMSFSLITMPIMWIAWYFLIDGVISLIVKISSNQHKTKLK